MNSINISHLRSEPSEQWSIISSVGIIVRQTMVMGVSAKDVTSNTILPSIFYVDYIACGKVDGNGTIGGKMTLVATNSVAMLPNFSVKQGGSLEARISNTGREQNTTEELPKQENHQYPLHMQARTNAVVALEKAAAEDVFTVSPNPIVTTAYVNYSIAKQDPVKITLYNLMGTVQDELVNENQPAGAHTYALDASGYKAGIYLLVFESGGVKQKRKVVITK